MTHLFPTRRASDPPDDEGEVSDPILRHAMTRIRLLHAMPLTALLMLALSACQPASAANDAVLPAPTLDAPKTSAHGEQVAVLAGGCFWGIEAVDRKSTRLNSSH